jgi:hypothetical protein
MPVLCLPWRVACLRVIGVAGKKFSASIEGRGWPRIDSDGKRAVALRLQERCKKV